MPVLVERGLADDSGTSMTSMICFSILVSPKRNPIRRKYAFSADFRDWLAILHPIRRRTRNLVQPAAPAIVGKFLQIHSWCLRRLKAYAQDPDGLPKQDTIP